MTLSKDSKNGKKRCGHWVLRKKRYCKMDAAKGKEFCVEHEPMTSANEVDSETSHCEERIPCPLDPKHSIYRKKLEKHLRICNAKPNDQTPAFIEKNINSGEELAISTELAEYSKLKLYELDDAEFYGVIEKVKSLYYKHIANRIEMLQVKHESLDTELAKEEYGHETRKHLIQTAALLGILEQEQQLVSETSFIEFGAGKGQLAFFTANVLQQMKLIDTQVILLDRMSLRHKKDNKVEDRTLVQRIRVDIADFKMSGLEKLNTKRNVAISKHLCGGATDLALRCTTQQQSENSGAVTFIMMAVCCHHRCDWRSYVGKDFLQGEEISLREFVIITKMVSWAICGTGMSRERRKALQAALQARVDAEVPPKDSDAAALQQQRLTLSEREQIGFMCKRVLDYGRLDFLRQQGYEASMKFYVPRDVTLENVCLIAQKKHNE